MGTAGLARCFVRGYRRVPAPPPRMTAATLLAFTFSPCGASQQVVSTRAAPQRRGAGRGSRGGDAARAHRSGCLRRRSGSLRGGGAAGRTAGALRTAAAAAGAEGARQRAARLARSWASKAGWVRAGPAAGPQAPGAVSRPVRRAAVWWLQPLARRARVVAASSAGRSPSKELFASQTIGEEGGHATRARAQHRRDARRRRGGGRGIDSAAAETRASAATNTREHLASGTREQARTRSATPPGAQRAASGQEGAGVARRVPYVVRHATRSAGRDGSLKARRRPRPWYRRDAGGATAACRAGRRRTPALRTSGCAAALGAMRG
jgi:hypothetical protein